MSGVTTHIHGLIRKTNSLLLLRHFEYYEIPTLHVINVKSATAKSTVFSNFNTFPEIQTTGRARANRGSLLDMTCHIIIRVWTFKTTRAAGCAVTHRHTLRAHAYRSRGCTCAGVVCVVLKRETFSDCDNNVYDTAWIKHARDLRSKPNARVQRHVDRRVRCPSRPRAKG